MNQKNVRTTDKPEKTLVIDIRFTGGVVLLLIIALLLSALIGYFAWNNKKVFASEHHTVNAGSTGLRQYYLTKVLKDGSQALTACASGYHMASMWEILDPSNLEYNTTLGYTNADSGQAPPTYIGWVRTGYDADTGTTPGQANCSVWTSSNGAAHGTSMKLASDWSAAQNLHVWNYNVTTCDNHRLVWCIED